MPPKEPVTTPVQTPPPASPIQPASVTTPTPAPVPTLSSVDWRARSEEFEARFKGLQASMQSAVEGHRTEVTDLTTQVTDLAGQRDTVDAQLTTLQQQHVSLSTEMEAAATTANLRTAELTKLQLIAVEAPDLSPYASFVSHVSPDGLPLDTEGIRANIEALNQIRTADLQATQTAFREGYVPSGTPAGTRDTLPTKEYVSEMIDKTAGVPGKTEEYLKWMRIRASLPAD